MPFTTILCKYISSKPIFFTKFIKTPHVYENMIIWPRNSTKNTGWGNIEVPRTAPRGIFLSPLNIHCRILLIQRPTKQLNPSHASLFDIIPSDILLDIDIWIYRLKHGDKYNHVILCFKYICNLIIFAIPHKLWNPYHNFVAFCWYNQENYYLAHRRILAREDGSWTCYKYYNKYSQYIAQINPELIQIQ